LTDERLNILAEDIANQDPTKSQAEWKLHLEQRKEELQEGNNSAFESLIMDLLRKGIDQGIKAGIKAKVNFGEKNPALGDFVFSVDELAEAINGEFDRISHDLNTHHALFENGQISQASFVQAFTSSLTLDLTSPKDAIAAIFSNDVEAGYWDLINDIRDSLVADSGQLEVSENLRSVVIVKKVKLNLLKAEHQLHDSTILDMGLNVVAYDVSATTIGNSEFGISGTVHRNTNAARVYLEVKGSIDANSGSIQAGLKAGVDY